MQYITFEIMQNSCNNMNKICNVSSYQTSILTYNVIKKNNATDSRPCSIFVFE